MSERRKILVLAVFLALASSLLPGQSDCDIRNTPDAKMAPRSLLLDGGPLDSARGLYVIDFPHPNECIDLGPIRASSRSMALYAVASKGGFSLKPAKGGLTIWTIEEWEALRKESWYTEFAAQHKKLCGLRSEPAGKETK